MALEKYHQILLKENIKAAPDISYFLLTCVKFLGHINKRSIITLIKSRTNDVIIKFQPPSSKKNQDFFALLNFSS